MHGICENTYKNVARKPERKRPFGCLRIKYSDNIKTDLKGRDRTWTGFTRLRIRWIEGSFEQHNETLRGLDLRSRNVGPYKNAELKGHIKLHLTFSWISNFLF